MAVHNYDLSKVSLTVNDIAIGGGYAEGDGAISVESSSDAWIVSTGAAGDRYRARSNDSAAIVKITLAHTSQENYDMEALYKEQQTSEANFTFPVTLRDSSNGTTFSTSQGKITKNPAQGRGQKIGPVDWEIDAPGWFDDHTVGSVS